MPSSLIFAGLALAWLVVLVPMVAGRRAPVARTADSVLASRVLQRRMPPTVRDRPIRQQEVAEMEQTEEPASAAEQEHRRLQREDAEFAEELADLEPEGAPHRQGRGGFDAEAAAIAAEAKYLHRQHVALALLIAAAALGLLALMVSPLLWWGSGVLGLALGGYLGYLRTQVRIENEVRRRRTERQATAQRAPAGEPANPGAHPPVAEEPIRPGAEVVELDDEDPAFAELDYYDRAAPQQDRAGVVHRRAAS